MDTPNPGVSNYFRAVNFGGKMKKETFFRRLTLLQLDFINPFSRRTTVFLIPVPEKTRISIMIVGKQYEGWSENGNVRPFFTNIPNI